MPAAPYSVELAVTVPVGANYVTCPQLEQLTAVELIKEWGDVEPMLRAHGHAIGRILRPHPYWGFRVALRGEQSRRLLGVGEWRKSAETGEHLPAMLWSAEGLFPLNPWGDGPVVPLTGLSHVTPRVSSTPL